MTGSRLDRCYPWLVVGASLGGIAALIDVMLGVVIAWLLHRPRLPGRALLDLVAMSALAVPGLVLGIGILRPYFHVHLPGGGIPSRRPGPC